jgi:hypothetical protein
MKNGVLWDVKHMALIGTDVSEELSAFIKVTRICELGTTLMKEALRSFETSVLTRATRRNIPEVAILSCVLRIPDGRQGSNPSIPKC